MTINYSLTGANGDTITFDNENYVLNPDFIGFNMAPAQVRIEESSGDGGVFRHQKKGVRDLDLVVTVLGEDRDDVQTKLRRLSRLLQNILGPTILTATYDDDTSLQIEVYYVGGAEGQWGVNAGEIYNRWVLSFQAPVPFWESTIEEDFVIGQEPTGRSLLPQLTKLRMGSGQVLGSIEVNNVGDVQSFARWEILGPVSNLVITNGIQSFSIPSVINSGDVVIIDTATGKVYNNDGANLYGLLGPAPKLFAIPAGESIVTLIGDDVNDDTRIGFYYKPRFEVVH
jgi:hypothetical protein